MNASFTEKKYESSYACIAASILGTRSNDTSSREKNGQKKAMLHLMLLFILNEKEATAAETKKTERERSLNALSLSLSLLCDDACLSVYVRA